MLYLAMLAVLLGFAIWANINPSRWTIAFILGLGIPTVLLRLETSYGGLEPADLALPIVAVIVLLRLATVASVPTRPFFPTPVVLAFGAFVLLAAFTTLLAPLRFPDMSRDQWFFGLLKLGKFVGYCMAGYAVAVSIGSEQDLRWIRRAIIVTGILTTGTLLYHVNLQDPKLSEVTKHLGYKANNAMAVALAAIVCYYALSTDWRGHSGWQFLARLGTMALLVCGLIASFGRGGWFGAAAGMGLSFRRRAARILLPVMIILFALAYENSHFVKNSVRRTFRLEPRTRPSRLELPFLDTSGRVETWVHHAKYVPRYPLFGHGFYIKGPGTGLPEWRSHNHFLQMLIDTGAVGLAAFAALSIAVWKATDLVRHRAEVEIERLPHPKAEQTSSHLDMVGRLARENMGFRAAFVAAMVASLSGSYLYGGVVVGATAVMFGSLVAGWRLELGARRRRTSGKPAVAGLAHR